MLPDDNAVEASSSVVISCSVVDAGTAVVLSAVAAAVSLVDEKRLFSVVDAGTAVVLPAVAAAVSVVEEKLFCSVVDAAAVVEEPAVAVVVALLLPA